MTSLTIDTNRLRRYIRALDAQRMEGKLDADGIEALVEACFRLALSNETSVKESLELLHVCARLDGTNPKPSYHLARVYFQHGAFDLAGRWLEVSARHCSTSHRIWAHIALLQREMNPRYRAMEKFEPNGLQLRAQSIFDLIRSGSHHFEGGHLDLTPPISRAWLESRKRQRQQLSFRGDVIDDEIAGTQPTAPFDSGSRLLNAGRCRWTGVYDLGAEDLMSGVPSAHLRSKILPGIAAAARLADSRPGGIAAFVILAIQWCVAGYPWQTVRRLRAALGPVRVTPSLELLDHVLALFQLPPAELAQHLADSIQRERLPVMLVAQIHHRCLLGVPVDSKILAKWRSAKRLSELLAVRTTPDAILETQADDIAKALLGALNPSSSRQRFSLAPLPEDELPPPLSATEAEAEFERLATATATLTELVRQARSTSPPPAEAWLDAATAAASAGSTRLDGLIASVTLARPEGLQVGFEKKAAGLRLALNAILYYAPLAALENDDSPESDAWTAGQELLGRLFSQEDTGPALNPAELLAEWEKEAAALKDESTANWESATALATKHKKSPLTQDELSQCALIVANVVLSEITSATRLKDIAEMRASGLLTSQVEIENLNGIETKFRELANQQGRFRRRFAGVPVPASPSPSRATLGTGATPEESPERTVEASPETDGPAPIEFSPDLNPAQRLSFAMTAFQEAVRTRFTAALDSFGPYGEEMRDLPPLLSLLRSARGRLAEALYRTGQHEGALAQWRQMLRDNRLHLPCLQNLAVGLWRTSRTGAELPAWRAYLEQLYFASVLQHSPRHAAAKRSEFHLSFGAAAAPTFLLPAPTPVPENWPEDTLDELLPFLESPGRVRHFVRHLTLAWFNSRLVVSSPPVILGTSRDDSQDTRTKAAAKLKQFGDHCRSFLPDRISKSFPSLVNSQLESALLACEDVHRLARSADSSYDTDYAHARGWLTEICKAKYHLFTLIYVGKDEEDRVTKLVARIQSLEFLSILRELDEIPLDCGQESFMAVAQKFHAKNPTFVLTLMDELRLRFLAKLGEFLGSQDGDDIDRRNRARQWDLLLTTWCHHPATRDSVALAALCLDHAKEAIARGNSERALSAAIAALAMDTRVAAVASNALGICRDCAEKNKACADTDRVAVAIQTWLERSAYNITADADDTDDDHHRLTPEDYDDTRRYARLAVATIAVSAGGTSYSGAIESTLDSLIKRHPWVQPALAFVLVPAINSAIESQNPALAKRLLERVISEGQKALASDLPLSTTEQEELEKAIKQAQMAMSNS